LIKNKDSKIFYALNIVVLITVLLFYQLTYADGKIQFISALKNAEGKWEFYNNTSIPNIADKAGYGWVMEVADDSMRKAIVTTTAPNRVVNWPKDATITSDGRTGTVITSIKPSNNRLLLFYTIEKGDPSGHYSMTVSIDNNSQKFEFDIVNPSGKGSDINQIEEVSLNNFKTEFNKLAQNDKYLDENNPFPKGTMNYKIHRQYLIDMLRNEKVVKKIYAGIKEQGKAVSNDNIFGSALGEEIVGQGFRKMSDSDKEGLLRIFRKMITKINVGECAKIIRGEGKKLTYSSLEGLDTKDVQKYYRILTNAMNAELNNEPIPTVSESQQQIVLDALINYIKKTLTMEKSELFFRLVDNRSSATDEELCWFGSVNLDAFLSFEGDLKKWALSDYFNSSFK
jgi:hypothetical protein